MLNKIFAPLARSALFIIYFWFGILKLLGQSPAGPLVWDLQQRTLPFLSFGTFVIMFALFEMLIGLLFLVPRLEKAALSLMVLHLAAAALPLVLLPRTVWAGAFAPTMEGQYIIKNLALLALAVGLAAKRPGTGVLQP